tara:strand:+ start:540 stop:1190 length:651 start_codon:yes stop_codon:yes gene_type:complete
MSEEEDKQKLPTRLEYILDNTAIIPILFLLFALRPEEGYIQRIEFLLFLIGKGVFLENIFIYQITSLLPLLIIIPLIFYRERVSTYMNNHIISQTAKEVIEEFDEDDDEKLTKEESQGFFSTIMQDLEEEEKKDLDALFDKYDSNKDGKLDGDEISSLILEVFAQELAYPNQESPSADEPVKVDSGEDEIQKLDRLYNDGYLSKERYERLKQDLSR